MERDHSDINNVMDIIEFENNLGDMSDSQISDFIDLYRGEVKYQEIRQLLIEEMADRIIEMPNIGPADFDLTNMYSDQLAELSDLYKDESEHQEARNLLIQEMARRIIEMPDGVCEDEPELDDSNEGGVL